MKKLLIAAAILCIAFAACKKDDGGQTNTTTTSRKDTLTTGKWMVSSMMLTYTLSGKESTVNIYDSLQACAKDDLYLFLTNGNVTIDQGTTKCDTSAPQQNQSGTWALNSSSDTLILDGVIPVGKYFKIVSFSNSTMQLRRDSSLAGIPATVTATFSHQ